MYGYQTQMYVTLYRVLLNSFSNSILVTPNFGRQHLALYCKRSIYTTGKKYPITKQKSRNDAQTNGQDHQDIRSRPQPTHFLSLPIASPAITGKLSSLLLNNSMVWNSALDSKTLMSGRNLHITIGVLHLPTSDDIQHASSIIMDHCSSIDRHQPLLIDIHSLDTMQGDPRMAHVLYAQVRDRSKKRSLHDLCESLRQKMMNHGFLKQEHRPLKLHVTLINTIYGKKSTPILPPVSSPSSDPTTTPMKMKRGKKPFDAIPILEALGDTHWGTCRLDTLHLMKIGRTGPSKTYESVSSFKI